MMDIDTEFVHLARLALDRKHEDVMALVRRSARALLRRRPDLSEQVAALVASANDGGLTRKTVAHPIPVDADTRLELLRREQVISFQFEPTWPANVAGELNAVVQEREHEVELVGAGLTPTRSMLFVGPPGVGKTMAARWLALKLSRPLLTLDLAAVMSSFLGRTGNNIRVVLDYARRAPSVLLLDEFDAIAKRRDDSAEVGELKRLVTVLLQSIDEWPAEGMLIAATNHPELLDPAVWRRFDRVVKFPIPSVEEVKQTIERILDLDENSLVDLIALLSVGFHGHSFSEITRQINLARRAAIVQKNSLSDSLTQLVAGLYEHKDTKSRIELARALASRGFSQRSIAEITHLARDTIRKHAPAAQVDGSDEGRDC